MKLLVFEFATAMGLKNPTITVEGQAMLEGLITDLKDWDLEYPLSPYSSLNLPEITDGPEKLKTHFKSIIIEEELTNWLDKNIGHYDACLPVAPEESLILYELTKIIEENKVKNIGSSSDAVYKCSDKFETYNLLRNDFPFPKTCKVFFNDLKKYKGIIDSTKKKMVVKPADGISCTGVQVVNTYADFIKASAHLKRVTMLPYFLLQEYVDGESISASILSNGKKATPLSLNLQKIQIEQGKIDYTGGKVPFEHYLSEKAKEIAGKAVEFMDGLKGYVGVDMLLNQADDQIYLLEINPRLTTSYVALRRLLNFNLGEAIIEAVEGRLPSEIILNGSLSFFKAEDIIFKSC